MLDASLSEDRYARHHILPEIGHKGQDRLGAARVLVVGAGGLGAPVLLYLAAAGIGHISIADDDVVSLSNLQRQVLHSTSWLDQPKTQSALARLHDLNPEIEITTYPVRIYDAEAISLVGQHDLVIDCTDNLEGRYVLNHACFKARVPLLSGAISGWEGHVGLYHPAQGGPCFACVFPEAVEERPAQNKGVVGALPGVVGATMALNAIKHITGAGASLLGKLLLIDTLWNEQRLLNVAQDPACPVCGGSHQEGC
ncbi:HesA/MoeB/ThiF family protein [Aliiroseovarius sp. F20344]|uniref:HesA/MoeB/ThiF family protein n=1 Tax=Aliiroseovarius sp. F20344 TaxID=2926414 RepID=UPI001FF289ED|nr:HesA/MoeB/ThiF family protein [Aliiroseovarius sp. F20344]MCK0143624.1 HesA/MoeB/ThiF family protein [Aliiroseovarius sp. F20344]